MAQYTNFTTINEGHKVEIKKDLFTHNDNSYLFTVYHEDHTIGNLITSQLLTEDRVLFAGYRIEHPLQDMIKIRVTVSDNVDRPGDMFRNAISDLCDNLTLLDQEFNAAYEDAEKEDSIP